MPHFLPIAGVALALLPCAAWAQAPPEPAAPLRLTLQDAMTRAQKYSQQTFNANIEALLAREDTRQAKAALLPTVNGSDSFP
jgi:outer membrane protein TolC